MPPSFSAKLPKGLKPIKFLINKPIFGVPKKLDTIADHIKKKRLESKLLQRQLGDRLGVNRDTVVKWENGRITNISATNYFNIVGFLNYCPLEEVPQTTGAQIFFYRKHRGISRRDLAKAIGTVDTEIKLWEKENFLVNCCGFGFTVEKRQALESTLQIDRLLEPTQTIITSKLPPSIQTMGQHLKHRREALNLSKREVEQILKLRRKNYTRWEEDDMKRLSPHLLVRVVEFLGYCPIESFSTEGQKLEVYRRYAGLEQIELVQSLNCLPKTLSHWECGRAKLSEKRKQQLKRLLSVCFDD